LQELAIQLESIDILAITSPSLQDFLGQELSSNSLLLHTIFDLTSPSLQDFQNGASYPVFFAKADYVPHIPDVGLCIFASNHDFVQPSIVGSPSDPFDILDHLAFFGVANGFFSPVGKLLCRRIDGFLPEDSEEKDVCSFDLHTGSFGPWFPSEGNHNLIWAVSMIQKQEANPAQMTFKYLLRKTAMEGRSKDNFCSALKVYSD
jgi:hypothetical protein